MIKTVNSKQIAVSRRRNTYGDPTAYRLPPTSLRGYTLVELIVAVGLFALVMVLASGAYLMMINFNRQVQGTITGIDNLSFALDSMTRGMRTGISYNCGGAGDCADGASSLSFQDETGRSVSYDRVDSFIQETVDGVSSPLTDQSVTITSLMFYVYGSQRAPGDYRQSRVTIVVSGTVSSGSGGAEPFTVETGATMRGSDI